MGVDMWLTKTDANEIMQAVEEIAITNLKEEEIYANVSSPTSTNMACPGASSNTEGRIPKGGCSTKPTVATALKKSRLHKCGRIGKIECSDYKLLSCKHPLCDLQALKAQAIPCR